MSYFFWQIATLEMKELNEKQRADHIENKCKLIQTQVSIYRMFFNNLIYLVKYLLKVDQLEKRNEELEGKFTTLSKANLEYQKVERELRDKLITSLPKEDFDQVNAKLQVK